MSAILRDRCGAAEHMGDAMPHKNDVVDEIASMLGLPPVGETKGSTGYKDALEEAVRRFGVPLPSGGSKPAMAEAIARHAGLTWDPTYDSRRTPSGGGSTVTVGGWQVVRDAVEILLQRTRA